MGFTQLIVNHKLPELQDWSAAAAKELVGDVQDHGLIFVLASGKSPLVCEGPRLL